MNNIYRISFVNQGKLYQLYAENVYQSEMYGFVVVEGLLFDHNPTLVIDPAEEKLKDEFGGVQRILVPIHSVVRVDELEKKSGASKIVELDGKGNIMPFPASYYPPSSRKEP
jgi:hypothetical protein